MARVAASLSEVLTAVKDSLVGAGVFTSAQCYITLDPDQVPLAPAASPICAVTFTEFKHREDTFSSEMDNEENPTMDGELVCAMWMRIALDRKGLDEHFITVNTDNVVGASEMIRRVFKALNNMPLVNPDGDEITWRTLNYIGFRQRGHLKSDPNWRRVDVRFNVDFEQKSDADDTVINSLLYSDDTADAIAYIDDEELVYA